MNIVGALQEARKKLDSSGVENSKLDSLILLSNATSLSKEQIIFNPESELTKSNYDIFVSFVERRCRREPVSHIIQKREFFGEEFFVNCDVLDPRPDSESLIELVLKIFPQKNDQIKILELGVGSGCLIITLLNLYKAAIAHGVDISSKELNICQKNAEMRRVDNRLFLKESDLFSQIDRQEKFDLIISNPPYIPRDTIKSLAPEVRLYEPITALDGGFDGLDFYRKIASQAGDFLKKEGKLVFEIGFGQEQEVIKICAENSFRLIEHNLDLAGIVRCLSFSKSAV